MSSTFTWDLSERSIVRYRPDNTIWFAAMMLPLVRSCETITIFGVPVIFLCLCLLAGQALILLYLHPFVWEETLECADGDIDGFSVLTATCTIILCFAVVADDLNDCFQTWEYLRLIPFGHGNLLFESRPSKGEQPVDLWKVKEGGIGHGHRAIAILVYILMRAASTLAILLYGIGYIAAAPGDDDKIKDCMAFLILTDLDVIFYRIAVPNIVKADLERVPDLCLTRDSASFTLFQRLSNIMGAWVKPALVAAFAVAMQEAYCRGSGKMLAIVYPACVAGSFCLFFMFSALTGKSGQSVKLDLKDVVIGTQDPASTPVPDEGTVLTQSETMVNSRWRGVMCGGPKGRDAHPHLPPGIMCGGPNAHLQPVEDSGAMRCRNCGQEIRTNIPWLWCGACQPTQSNNMLCSKCYGEMSTGAADAENSRTPTSNRGSSDGSPEASVATPVVLPSRV